MGRGDDEITQTTSTTESSPSNGIPSSVANKADDYLSVNCDDEDNEKKQKPISYIVLGDGDFSFSLDLCRYFHTYLNIQRISNNNVINTPNFTTDPSFPNQAIIQVRATGIDSMDDLKSKYNDIDSILRKLRELDTTTNKKKSPKIKVSIDHEINAIQPWTSSSTPSDSASSKTTHMSLSSDTVHDQYHHVIFNHPHIGTEDAELHARFISHLLYSARNHWLKKGGVIHITLVLNQCERWKCLQSAKVHSMDLLHRTPFRPPPSPAMIRQKLGIKFNRTKENSEDFHLYFHQRRHQNGRSFAKRAKIGSEILTFGRSEDKAFFDHTTTIVPTLSSHLQRRQQLLPWLGIEWNAGGNNTEHDLNNKFSCPHCGKSFREERSKKNHIKSSHPHIVTKNSNISTNSTSVVSPESDFSCELCKPTRLFASLQALTDHKRAKHFLFTEIKPEWAASVKKSNKNHSPQCKPCENSKKQPVVVNNETLGKEQQYCEVCNFHYVCEDSKKAHEREFLPQSHSTPTIDSSASYNCDKCDKQFKNMRALMQHQNFCQSREICKESIV